MAKTITYATPETLHTRNYDQFKIVGGNRPTSKWHIQNLVGSYADNPDLIELRPILVNENLEIIDGQNRIEAMRILGIEVPYQVVPGLTISAAQLMNAISVAWTLDNFAQSYAYEGNPHYKKFDDYRVRYGIATSTLINYIGAGIDGRGSFRKRFKLGYFAFPEDTSLIDSRLQTLQKIQEVSGIENTLFALSLLRFIEERMDFDRDKLIRGINAMGGLERRTTQTETLEDLAVAYARG